MSSVVQNYARILLVGISVLVLGFTTPLADARSAHWSAKPPIHVLSQITSLQAGQSPGYNPAQIRHAYGFDSLASTGAGQIIGLVDAYDAPHLASDVKTFSQTFNLPLMNGLPGQPSCSVTAGPHPCFEVAYSGSKPATDAGWAQETSLDAEWAHAIAPQADIIVTEAKSASQTNLLSAVDLAVKKGASTVSMSWGGPELSNQTTYDKHFKKSSVTFFAASGDSGNGASWPSSSGYVVSVGGTRLSLDSQGNRLGTEKAWTGSGGGISHYTKQPTYQVKFGITSDKFRATPDVAYNADPQTGYRVYDSLPYNGQSGWMVIGGTSAASPQWAALTALINQGRSRSLSSNSVSQSPFYTLANTGLTTYFHDVKSGSNGDCKTECHSAKGYDFVTGLGSPVANKLIPYLQSH